jgi:hypothetical protein
MIGIPTRLAAGASLVALGSLAGYMVGSGPNGEQSSAVAAKRQPVEVRTQTIRRTVRVVKHERPRTKQPQPAPALPVARATPVAPQAAPTPPASSPSLRTRTSGAGPSSGEHEHGEERERGEHEGGDD